MFNPIEININYGFISIYITVLGIIISWIYKQSRTIEKSIRVDDVHFKNILFKPTDIVDRINITFNDIKIEKLDKVQVILFNSGNQTLNYDDFNIPPTLDIVGFTNILCVNVSTSFEHMKIDVNKNEESKLELILNNFEPKKYVKIEFYFESIDDDYKPNFKFCLKEQKNSNTDLKFEEYTKEFEINKAYNSIIPLWLLIFLITVGLTYLFTRFGLGINPNNPKMFAIGWKILFFVPATIMGIVFAIFHYRLINIE